MKLRQVTFAACAVLLVAGVAATQDAKPGEKPMDDFMTGKASQIRMITTIMDPDHHMFAMWGPDPKGKSVKQMEIHYRRRK